MHLGDTELAVYQHVLVFLGAIYRSPDYYLYSRYDYPFLQNGLPVISCLFLQ